MKRDIGFKRFIKILYFLSFAIYLLLVLDGFDYYRLPYQERPRHPEYRQLRPAGVRSHGCGIVGSLMMILMLGYSLRKRVKFMRNWGPISRWLQIHIYFGIMGPLLIILHTSFKVQGLVAVSFWSMIAVAFSGVLGRYLYLQIPHNVAGEEIDLLELEKENQKLAEEIAAELAVENVSLKTLFSFPEFERIQQKSLAGLLLWMLWDDISRPWKIRRLLQSVSEMGVSEYTTKKFAVLVRQKMKLQRRILLLAKIHELFHYWHVIHKPFAFVMYLIMAIHIGIAIWLGYTWIF